MKNKQYYEFVPKKIYGPYLNRAFLLVQGVVKKLNTQGIHSKCYLIGSAGKRHMVTRLVVNGKLKPFDVDINIEIDNNNLPKKYTNLKKLKEHIRVELNKAIDEKKEYFSDGENSTSVISCPLHFTNDSSKTEFSFDVGIVSRNSGGNLQRLIANKSHDLYTWSKIKNTSSVDERVKKIIECNLWNELRNKYLETKNRLINDKNSPSFVCYKIAVEEVHQKALLAKKKTSQKQYKRPKNWDPVGDSAMDD
ncbi:MAG: hypothetical protein J6I53_05250 [Treponema sp.]|nr:hypothetical protein [Treponema sp.]